MDGGAWKSSSMMLGRAGQVQRLTKQRLPETRNLPRLEADPFQNPRVLGGGRRSLLGLYGRWKFTIPYR